MIESPTFRMIIKFKYRSSKKSFQKLDFYQLIRKYSFPPSGKRNDDRKMIKFLVHSDEFFSLGRNRYNQYSFLGRNRYNRFFPWAAIGTINFFPRAAIGTINSFCDPDCGRNGPQSGFCGGGHLVFQLDSMNQRRNISS